jgi:hypothetical protein
MNVRPFGLGCPAVPRSPLALVAALAVLMAPAAQADFFPGDVIDGPSPDIVRVGGVDVARDGTGALVYVKRDTGVEHVFASRLVGGAFLPPERLDPGLLTPSGEPVVAVANGGRIVVAFTNAGTLYTVFRPAGATAWGTPAALSSPAATPAIDMSTNGVAYVVWAASGDVRAARMDRLETAFTPLSAPLDIDPNDDAGSGTGRPVVAAPADGTAFVAWGENGHVYARRLLGLTQSAFPQDATVTSFEGHTGGMADLPSVDAPDDSSFSWLVFRQTFDNGATTRALARRFAGSTFDPPFDIGGGGFGGEGTDTPAVDASGANDVAFASDTSATHTPYGELYYGERLLPPFGLGAASAVPTQPAVAIGESSSTVMAWLRADAVGGPVSVVARTFKRGAAVGVQETLSVPEDGSVDSGAGFFAAADKAGDTAIPYVETDGTNRRLMVSTWDRPPANMFVATSIHWHNWPVVRWLPASEYWGKISYRVQIDGRTVGTFARPAFSPRGLVSDGAHRFVVVAVDRRGQTEASPPRTLRIDTKPPLVGIRLKGRKRAGRPLTVLAHARDPGPRADSSRIDYVHIDFGDGTPPVNGARAVHAYVRGRYTLRVVAADSAVNRTIVSRSVTIR